MRTRPPSVDDESAQHSVVRPVTPLVSNEEVMDELLVADESPLAGQLDEPSNDATLYAEYRRLVEEQAAARRLGTLVARGVEPSELAGVVTEEMRKCVGAATGGLWSFDTSDEIRMVAAAAAHPAVLATGLARWPLGTRTPIEGNTLATMVHRTGLPARIDSYDHIGGAGGPQVPFVWLPPALSVPLLVVRQTTRLLAAGFGQTHATPPT